MPTWHRQKPAAIKAVKKSKRESVTTLFDVIPAQAGTHSTAARLRENDGFSHIEFGQFEMVTRFQDVVALS